MKSKNSPLLSCWPDGYSRYYSIANILRIVFSEKKIDILDVGGDSQWMSKFLDDNDLDYGLSIVDTRKPDFKNADTRIRYVREDFFKIKPSDFPSDVVMNTDVLEHIPADLKVSFINQCIDFSKSVVIFSAPQDHSDVTYAEEQIDNNYKKYTKKPQYWLKEHFEFGKPDPAVVEKTIKAHDLPYLVVNTNNLDNWLLTFSLNFINSELLGLAGMDEFNRFYNQHIHQVGDFEGEPYRKIFIVFKDVSLYEKYRSDILQFFRPDSSLRTEFLGKALSLIVDNVGPAVQNKDKEIAKLSKSLSQTQSALIDATTELHNIKSSRSYRYTSKVNKLIGR